MSVRIVRQPEAGIHRAAILKAKSARVILDGMGTKDPRVDAYISKSASFAKPILNHLRKVVHSACADIEEDMKWGFPHFMYKGMLCSMASFKAHCAFGFWKGKLVIGADGKALDDAMGQFGRLTSISDLPPEKVLAGYVKQAMSLNDSGIKKENPPPKAKKPLDVPSDLAAALKKNKKAQATFDAFSPSHKREYLEWLEEAKRDETRQKRLETAVEWMAEGKSRHWKYAKC